jgi:hypothetical protein
MREDQDRRPMASRSWRRAMRRAGSGLTPLASRVMYNEWHRQRVLYEEVQRERAAKRRVQVPAVDE